MVQLCFKELTRKNSKYDQPGLHRCFREFGHSGKCDEFPYLAHLKSAAPTVARKIIRDATKTTGAAWKSAHAGPNRISRWTMLCDDETLLGIGINMAEMKPWVIAKLRDKSATYADCMSAAAKLTWLAYGMQNAPELDIGTKTYLESSFGTIRATTCFVCRESLDFGLFNKARIGRAEIETGHPYPRKHTQHNIGFVHRRCNIAQGDKSLDEFYSWIHTVLLKSGYMS